MRKVFVAVCLVCSLLVMQGCQKDMPELKSPCVGAEGSPCGPTRSVNDWWMGDKSEIS